MEAALPSAVREGAFPSESAGAGEAPEAVEGVATAEPAAMAKGGEAVVNGTSSSSEAGRAELAEAAYKSEFAKSAVTPVPEEASFAEASGMEDVAIVEAGASASAAATTLSWASGTGSGSTPTTTGACGGTGNACVDASACVEEVPVLASPPDFACMPAAVFFLPLPSAWVFAFTFCWTRAARLEAASEDACRSEEDASSAVPDLLELPDTSPRTF